MILCTFHAGGHDGHGTQEEARSVAMDMPDECQAIAVEPCDHPLGGLHHVRLHKPALISNELNSRAGGRHETRLMFPPLGGNRQ
jgi:hypothetical protein